MEDSDRVSRLSDLIFRLKNSFSTYYGTLTLNEEIVQSVSQLTDAIKFTLNDEFSDVWVSGEVSGLSRPQSGHIYLTLKDSSAQVSTVIWRSTADRLRFLPENGMQVLCRGYVDVYPQRGTFQLIIRSIQPLGQGSLQIAFRQLHDRLKSEGLFDDSIKKPIPRFPRRIAVITSPTGAAVHDFIQVATRRWPHFDILIVPVPVQGQEAAPQIARAIKICGHKKFDFQPDVIVVTRGGGSIEDLWSFNDETVVRAIHKSTIPVISAIGHEVDVSLSDLVADLRAQTPTEAAEIIAPDIDEIDNNLKTCALRLRTAIVHSMQQNRSALQSTHSRPSLRQPLNQIRNFALQLDTLDTKLTQMSQRRFELTRQFLDHCLEKLTLNLQNSIPNARNQLNQILARPAFSKPTAILDDKRQKLQALQARLESATSRRLQFVRNDLNHSVEMLNAFNPENILGRGYSLTVNSDGSPVVDCDEVNAGDKLVTWLGKGKITSTVESKSRESKYLDHGQEKN